MYCTKCGDIVEQGEKYCNKCGTLIDANVITSKITAQPNSQLHSSNIPKISNNNRSLIYIAIGVFLLFAIVAGLFTLVSKKVFNFTNTNYETETSTTTNKPVGPYQTSVVYDNTYVDQNIAGKKDAISLITKDSNIEKSRCTKQGISAIEKNIQEKYGVMAANLCELDLPFAEEIESVVKTIYNDFPTVRGYLTNLTLVNASISEGYIAAFQPGFIFAKSNTSSTYPWVIKTQILLNSTYFLNVPRLQASVADASKSGHFPKNTTRYSPVAHEFGHYMSFLATINSYNLSEVILIDTSNYEKYIDIVNDFNIGTYTQLMINEAYKNSMSKNPNSTYSELDFRSSISNYAIAKDSNNDYIYDETIAEAFHDYYLNGDKAARASQEIVSVLKKHLEVIK